MGDELWPAKVAAILLKCVPLGVLVLFGTAQTAPNNYPCVPNGPYWTLLDVTQMVLLFVSTGLSVTKGSFALGNVNRNQCVTIFALREAMSDYAMALSLILVTWIVWKRHQRCLPPSAFAASLLGLLSTGCALDAFLEFTTASHLQEITLSANNFREIAAIVIFVTAAAVAGNFLLSEVQDLVIERPKHTRKSADQDTLSVLGRQVSITLIRIYKSMSRKGRAATEEFPKLRRGLACERFVKALGSRLSARKMATGKRFLFSIALLKVFWVDVLRVVLAVVGYYACIFARIPALELLIDSRTSVGMATATFLFVATTTGEMLMSSYQMEVVNMSGCRVDTVLRGFIFKKVTSMSTLTRARYTAGRITSMLTVDCWQMGNCVYVVPMPLFGVLSLPIVFWMLAARTGVGPSLCCAAWTVFILCLPALCSSFQKRLWAKVIGARDERLKVITDLLAMIRIVKMYAWEDALQKNVLRFRETELQWLFRVNLLDAILDCLYSSTSSVLMIILFSTLRLLEPEIAFTPALAFSCVSLLYMTDLSMNTCGHALRNITQGSLAIKRIADFCTAEEEENSITNCKTSASLKKGAVKIEKCYFSWAVSDTGVSEAQLEDIDLEIEPGSLVGIVGFVGSGKSSLLSAILGDMHVIEGKVATMGRTAFVPQLPAVHNMTVRDNILYGKPMNLSFYHHVIQSCQLINDINMLATGDMTEIGEKGSNLSGGQKQRISIARAVYSQSDVYLLDDPLSALDPIVASRVFKDVIGKKGLLRHKTRIMVCNQAKYLHYMDKLILVDKKRIKVYDKVEDLINDPKSPKNFREALQDRTTRLLTKNETDAEKMEENDVVGRITGEESGQSSKTGWQLLCSLLRFTGWPAVMAVLTFVAAACAFATQQVWIKWGTTDATTNGGTTAIASVQLPWVPSLVALCLIDVAFRIAGSILLALSAKHLSRSLHNDMLGHVLQSPVSFFDESPRGRIVNRFSADIDHADSRAFISGKQSVQNTLLTVAKIAIVGTQAPVVIGITLVLAVLVCYGLCAALRASHHCRYYESLAMSRLLQHATETVDALSSVRTYGVADRFASHFYRLTDEMERGLVCFGYTYCFVRTLTAVAGFVVIMCTLLTTVVFAGPGGPDPASLGLALSSACSVSLSLLSLCVMLFNVLQMTVSFERCVEYSELPPESDVPTSSNETNVPPTQCPTVWPSSGMIQFQKYSASYRPGVLPNVLEDVTFDVKPLEKVGVVGRTGAGKSSLVLALLRMLRPSEGHILIDGVNIANVPLRKLRRSITVIPQDPSLVRGTLRTNLDPTNSHSDEDIWEALERSHLSTFVSSDAKGLLLETTDGGTNLSVGQRQLVCLARALLRRSKILLLDEATSQMDGDTDRLIQATLRDAFANCTLLTVAHRIHTVLDYDRILVLEEGKVKEFDSVSVLLSDSSSAFYSMAVEAGICVAAKNSNLITAFL
ncbi:ATP-binding cassette sub-family C member 2-like isoform X1 [Dermacentor albipictus]|uniref:ATP-binding cassette sub-family C member 2-like isoform X1 n=3 Tax=Dermacentor albipictus TaxID=60249 RepID=UPI0031FD9C1C